MRVDLTVVLTTRDRHRALERTLTCLQAQEPHACTWNTIVVDDGSTDATASVLNRTWPCLSLTVLREGGCGVSAARNVALASVDADLIVFTDDDVAPTPRWLFELSGLAVRWPDDAVFGGPILPEFPDGAPAWLRTSVFVGPLFTGFAPQMTEGPLQPGVVPLGPNTMVRRSSLGPIRFDPTIGPGSGAGQENGGYAVGSDVDFAARAVERAGRAIYSPKAAVRHAIRRDQLSGEWMRFRAFNWGRGVSRLFPEAAEPGRDGVPDYLWSWLETTREHAAPIAAQGGSSPAHESFEHVLRWEFVRGLIFEERQRHGHRSGNADQPRQRTDPREVRRTYAGAYVGA
jgi:glycosyltransferase involved in cell wall biosynthesis